MVTTTLKHTHTTATLRFPTSTTKGFRNDNKQNYLKNELVIKGSGGLGMKQPLGQAEGLGNSFLITERLEDFVIVPSDP